MKSDSIQDNQINKHFLNPTELAEYFGVSLKTVYRLMENRKISFYKIGRCVRFRKEDVEKYNNRVLVESICK